MHEEPEEVYRWLLRAAKRRHIEATFHLDRVKQVQNWLYIPVYVSGEDVLDKVTKLQRIEDAWRNQHPEPYWQLMLIPAAN